MVTFEVSRPLVHKKSDCPHLVQRVAKKYQGDNKRLVI
jgi:hypothetical protein